VSDLLMASPLAIASRRVVVQLPQVVEEGVALVLDLEVEVLEVDLEALEVDLVVEEVEVLEVDLEEEEVDGSVPPHAAG